MIPSANPAARPLCAALLFGGLSSEHEVSRVSAVTFAEHMDPERYELIKIASPKRAAGFIPRPPPPRWRTGSWEQLPGNMPCVLSPDRADHGAHPVHTRPAMWKSCTSTWCWPVLHGLWGEDGHHPGPAGAGRHPLCGLRRPGQRGLHGQSGGQRPGSPATASPTAPGPPTPGPSWRPTLRASPPTWPRRWAGPSSSSLPTPAPAWG